MNEWNIRQKDLEGSTPPGRGGRTRVAFCPTCRRPFLRGTGVRQEPEEPTPPGSASPAPPPELEYCSERCLPGRPA